jgi:hypothetical protein
VSPSLDPLGHDFVVANWSFMKTPDQIKEYARRRMKSAIERFIAAKTPDQMARAKQWPNVRMCAGRLIAPPAGRSDKADRLQGARVIEHVRLHSARAVPHRAKHTDVSA